MSIAPPPLRVQRYRLFMCIETTNNSTVYLASMPPSAQKLILKFIPLDGHSPLERIDNECRTQSEVQHPYIMQLDSFFDFQNYRVMAMPRAIGGSVLSALAENDITSISSVCMIMFRLLHAVHYLHQISVLHGDIKPANVVLMTNDNSNPQPKLIDFGHATYLNSTDFCQCNLMTCTYSAPEVLSQQPHSFPSDIWSLGATFYYLVTCQNVLHLKDLPLMIREAMDPFLTFDSRFGHCFPETGRILIREMLNPDPCKRPTADICLKSGLFVEILGNNWIRNEEDSIMAATVRTLDVALEQEEIYT